jgi:4-hydroxythreonine-4-phosphate dehydrogenase
MSNSARRSEGSRPTIAVTPGEPAGIGPDLMPALADFQGARLVFVADPELLTARAVALGRRLRLVPFDPAALPPAGHAEYLRCDLRAPSLPGRLDAANAPYVLECLERASTGCLEGRFDAMLTGPVHKGVVNDAGIPFTGHTEYLAALGGGVRPVMMLVAGRLRVALVTTHVPLREVPALITASSLRHTLRTVAAALSTEFGIAAPRIAVCGLNPHAGEGGHLGREELEVIEPVLTECRTGGLALIGPVPADTAFTPEAVAASDAIVAMYHDQGLAALKALGFGGAVNVTLGLPFIRTSVDHGTALDVAGTGRARAESLRSALELAVELAGQRRRASSTT